MKRGTVSAAVALMLLAAGAPALGDDRLIERPYNQNEVVRVDGKTGVQAAIAFGGNESIENVAVGDSQSWQITPNKRADLLFVKPLEASARTNMTVVTNRHTYFFDLVASPRAKPVYMLRFTYADEAAAKTTVASLPGDGAATAKLDPAEQAVAEGDLVAMPRDPAALNFAWKRTGDGKLQPSRVYDDGVSTYLFWPERSAVPAILIKNETGEEGPVNYAVRGNAIVISEVPAELVLRSGKAMARLENQRPAAPTAEPASPTLATNAAPTRPNAANPVNSPTEN